MLFGGGPQRVRYLADVREAAEKLLSVLHGERCARVAPMATRWDAMRVFFVVCEVGTYGRP